MSTVINERESDWLSGDPDQKFNPVTDLIIVVSGQFEEAGQPFNGWLEVECLDCGAIETQQMSVSQFAEYLDGKGWSAVSTTRSTLVCPACCERADKGFYSPQFADNRGLLG